MASLTFVEMPPSRLGCQKETQLLNGIDKTREGGREREREQNYESKRPLLLKLLQARQFGTPMQFCSQI